MPKTPKTFTNFVTGEEVTPTQWQLDLKPGDFYIIQSEIAGQAVTVYGIIVKRYGRARLGMWQVLAYSTFCPDGEGGILHICDPSAQITQAEFKQAQAQGWAVAVSARIQPLPSRQPATNSRGPSGRLPRAVLTHNSWTIYALDENGDEVDSPIASLSRPQDWGGVPSGPRWHYEFFRFEWHTAEAIYVNFCHCYTDLVRERWQYPELFAPLVAQILQPGRPPQLCGREYLRGPLGAKTFGAKNGDRNRPSTTLTAAASDAAASAKRHRRFFEVVSAETGNLFGDGTCWRDLSGFQNLTGLSEHVFCICIRLRRELSRTLVTWRTWARSTQKCAESSIDPHPSICYHSPKIVQAGRTCARPAPS